MKQELIELAQRHIDKVRSRDRSLEKEQEELEQRLYEIKDERNSFEQKLLRSVEYDASSGVCPVCFIDNGSSIKFKPMPGDDAFDKFECSHCGVSIDVQV